jgi:hypothetical protein
VTIEATINAILAAASWTQRIQQIRLIPQRHGTGEHPGIYAAVARALYMPHLAPDFAYIHESPFYEKAHFFQAYEAADRLTGGFNRVTESDLVETLTESPGTLLVFRTLIGLTGEEFAHSTLLAGGPANLEPLSSSQIDKMERQAAIAETRPNTRSAVARVSRQAVTAAKTIVAIMDGQLFGDAPPGLRSKQQKPDTERGWDSVRDYASAGVPLQVFLHQRHYGGAFRQVLDATSSRRKAYPLCEPAVTIKPTSRPASRFM